MPKLAKILILICLFTLLYGQAYAETLCLITEKQSCEKSSGCQKVKNSIIITIDIDQRRYSRCDSKGCDKYQATFTKSGEFINVTIPERSIMAKIGVSDLSFVEIVTLGLTALVSFGACKNP